MLWLRCVHWLCLWLRCVHWLCLWLWLSVVRSGRGLWSWSWRGCGCWIWNNEVVHLVVILTVVDARLNLALSTLADDVVPINVELLA